jgi:hypothetical protein
MTIQRKRVKAKSDQVRSEQEHDREGYARQPQTPEELSWFEADPVWLEEETTEDTVKPTS